MALVSAMHITAGVWVNDDEPGIQADTLEWLDKLAPPSWSEPANDVARALSPDPGDYRHHARRRGQRRRPSQEPARPPPGDRPGDRRQARPRALAGDLLRRVRRPQAQAAGDQGARRVAHSGSLRVTSGPIPYPQPYPRPAHRRDGRGPSGTCRNLHGDGFRRTPGSPKARRSSTSRARRARSGRSSRPRRRPHRRADQGPDRGQDRRLGGRRSRSPWVVEEARRARRLRLDAPPTGSLVGEDAILRGRCRSRRTSRR